MCGKALKDKNPIRVASLDAPRHWFKAFLAWYVCFEIQHCLSLTRPRAGHLSRLNIIKLSSIYAAFSNFPIVIPKSHFNVVPVHSHSSHGQWLGPFKTKMHQWAALLEFEEPFRFVLGGFAKYSGYLPLSILLVNSNGREHIAIGQMGAWLSLWPRHYRPKCLLLKLKWNTQRACRCSRNFSTMIDPKWRDEPLSKLGCKFDWFGPLRSGAVVVVPARRHKQDEIDKSLATELVDFFFIVLMHCSYICNAISGSRPNTFWLDPNRNLTLGFCA